MSEEIIKKVEYYVMYYGKLKILFTESNDVQLITEGSMYNKIETDLESLKRIISTIEKFKEEKKNEIIKIKNDLEHS